MQISKFKILNKTHLQLIAVLAMTLDHLTWFFFPGYSLNPLAITFHIIGRIVKGIMAFFIAEGYHYTHNKKKYLIRILIFAIISHVPYMMQSIAFKEYGWMALVPFATGKGIGRFLNQTNVLFSYFFGLLMLMVKDSKYKEITKTLLILLLCVLSFPTEWSCIGPLIILVIGSNRGHPKKQIFWALLFETMYNIIYIFSLNWVYGLIQFGIILTIPLLFLYNGKKSDNPKINKFFKYFFYIYYPVHLLVIGLLVVFLH